jgi:hypothetical protein
LFGDSGAGVAKGGMRLGDPVEPLVVFRFLGVVVSVGDLEGDFLGDDLVDDDNKE